MTATEIAATTPVADWRDCDDDQYYALQRLEKMGMSRKMRKRDSRRCGGSELGRHPILRPSNSRHSWPSDFRSTTATRRPLLGERGPFAYWGVCSAFGRLSIRFIAAHRLRLGTRRLQWHLLAGTR